MTILIIGVVLVIVALLILVANNNSDTLRCDCKRPDLCDGTPSNCQKRFRL